MVYFLIAGCIQPQTLDVDVVDSAQSHEPAGFSWVVPQQLAGMAQPGRYGDLEDDVAWMADEGITLLVSLTEHPTDADLLADYDIALLHLPVEDFTPPTIDQMNTFIEATESTLAAGGRVGVHCTAGIGRTGTTMAVWFTHDGMKPRQAISHIRDLRPGSIETDEQERFVSLYYETLN